MIISSCPCLLSLFIEHLFLFIISDELKNLKGGLG
ncbi:hypothetical protein COM17_17960, partial [Bacillus altitudinis]